MAVAAGVISGAAGGNHSYRYLVYGRPGPLPGYSGAASKWRRSFFVLERKNEANS